ncbi:MAG: DUF1292 domain-containing protein [Syntrophaceticus sp.]
MSLDWEEGVCLVLEDEEGQEHEFTVIKMFFLEDEEYIVLQPVNEDEQFIFKITRDENGDEFLCEIEDEEKWEQVADAYREMISEEEI